MGQISGQTAYPDFNSFEIVQTNVVDVSATSSPTNWTTVPHGLGYAPMIMAFLNNVNFGGIFTGGNLPLPTFINSTITGGVVQFNSYLFAAVDDTNVYLIILNGTGGSISALPVKYYLLRESAN